MHVYSQADTKNMLLFNHYLGIFINSIGNIGVSCFILISGYFGVKLKWERFLQIIILTTFYSVLLYFVNKNFDSGSSFLNSFLVIPLYKNWFITCYLVLMLLSPYLNKIFEIFSRKDLEKLLLTMFIIFSILPTLFNTPFYTILTGGGKCLVYFTFIYLIGRYIRLYQDKTVEKRKSFLGFILMTSIIIFLNITIGLIFNKKCSIYAMDCSPFILVSAICVFYFFKSFKFQSNIINYLASSILAVYLMDGLRLFINHYVINISAHSDKYDLAVYILMEIILVFLIAILIDKTRIFLFEKWENKFIKLFLNKLIIHTPNQFKK